jgi:hypothetical protein
LNITEINDGFEAVQEALASGDVPELMQAETQLSETLASLKRVLEKGNLKPDQLRDWRLACERLKLLIASAGGFYFGLASAMKVQLQGYGNTPLYDRDHAGSRFAVEG